MCRLNGGKSLLDFPAYFETVWNTKVHIADDKSSTEHSTLGYYKQVKCKQKVNENQDEQREHTFSIFSIITPLTSETWALTFANLLISSGFSMQYFICSFNFGLQYELTRWVPC